MKFCVAALASIFLLFFAPLPAESQGVFNIRTGSGGRLVINAEQMSRDFERKQIELKGNVQLIFDQQYVSCDHAVVDLEKQEILAEGHLVMSSTTSYVEGDQATLNYQNNTGIIYNGFVKSGQVIFEGKVVRKLGPSQFEAESASYTACTTCPTAWSFTGSRIRGELGGYAFIKNSVLEIAGLPVLWLPVLIVPLKSERQTGLLIPSISYSGSGGTAMTFHFFWAISRSQDATLTTKLYALRGQKGLVNYRYMLTERSFGELNTGTIRDKVFGSDAGLSKDKVGPKINRWFFSYFHSYDLPYDFVQNTSLNLVSDLRYSRDFPDELGGQGDPALVNRVSLARNTESTHSSLDAMYFINQLKENPLASNEDAVHRWPALRFSAVERPLFGTNLLFNFNTDYVNFSREDFGFDDIFVNAAGEKAVDHDRNMSSGGVFDPTRIDANQKVQSLDVVRAGQRLDMQPEISYPFHVGRILDINPSIQFRHTQYSLNVTPQPNSDFNVSPYRHYLRGRLSTRTRFSRVYGSDKVTVEPNDAPVTYWVDRVNRIEKPTDDLAKIRKPNKYRHEIEPEIVLAGIPYLNQSDSPFFGDSSTIPSFLVNQPISNSDFFSNRGIQFDYYDRVFHRNTVSFILNNKLIRKTWSSSQYDYKQIATFRLSQSYDIDEARREGGKKFPWSDVSALLDVRLDHFETNTLLQYFPYHNVTNTSARVRVKDDIGNFLELGVGQSFRITENTDEAYTNRSENVAIGAGLKTKYITIAGGLSYLPESWWTPKLKVKTWNADINLRPPGNCWGIRASFRQDIGGEVIPQIDFDYNFGGEAS